jgi:hypothetical protein
MHNQSTTAQGAITVVTVMGALVDLMPKAC